MAWTESHLRAQLRKMEKNWPEGYRLFSWSGTLCLMEDDPDPQCRTPARDLVIETFPGISNDGGDPD